MTTPNNSQDSLANANRNHADFSTHGRSLGAAGHKITASSRDCEFLSQPEQQTLIEPGAGGLGKIIIGAAWENIEVQESGFFGKLFKKVTRQGVDIDLGCLYELEDGTRGAIQAFGDMLGQYDGEPYIRLSGDERTGNAEGHDEHLEVNGAEWSKIKRMVVYVYIYDGAHHWDDIRPEIHVLVDDHSPMIVKPTLQHTHLSVCAIATIENYRGAIRLTNHTEYFPGHAEMDRAFGFGLEWDDGRK